MPVLHDETLPKVGDPLTPWLWYRPLWQCLLGGAFVFGPTLKRRRKVVAAVGPDGVVIAARWEYES